ncbi:MAG: single-stranded DNA-binding protein [Actinomycetaceae bacterium]|nr:single-stranded DNA-binding protein [Actinomycetaceae bacterium]
MTTVTVIGNIAQDPELRYTASGKAVCNMRVLENRRRKNDNGEWVDDTPLVWPVTVWDDAAANAYDALSKGDRVVVIGSITQQPYETAEGYTVQQTAITAKEVARSVRFAPKAAEPPAE